MDCRRAFDCDLADFVADAGRAEWAEFRAHYPRCPDCAAEVRAWTEVHLVLQGDGAHPAPDALLRFASSPGALPAAERAAMERHLGDCPSCRDELATLARFDFAALAPARRGLVERARNLVLHPAFAYALVLLLLYPALIGRPPSPPAKPAAKEAEGLADRSRNESADEEKMELYYEEPDVSARQNAGREQPAAPPAIGWLARAKRALAEPSTPRLLLDRRAPLDVPAGAAVVLAVPVAGQHAAGTLKVRLVDPERRREIGQEFVLTGAEEHVDLPVPSGWLSPGAYVVESRGAVSETFRLRVAP